MFAVREVTVRAPFEAAGRRLTVFVGEGALRVASEAAYQDGLDAGPLTEPGGAAKLARVQCAKPVQRGSTLRAPLRWEVTGPAGEPFAVLDADLTLSRDRDGRTQLRLDGSYRPPIGPDGRVPDQAVLSRVTVASLCCLLDNVADAIADPAPEPQPGAVPIIRWWPGTGEP
ncbi:MAG: hypothetical protein ACLPKE_12465 [Streptosporangiaceae bacterium]